jgi:hypothetical protein
LGRIRELYWIAFGTFAALTAKKGRMLMVGRDTLRFTCTILGVALATMATSTRAANLSWDIDPAQSFVRLTIPDQQVTLEGTTATIRLRDNGSTSEWTDAGGRRAFIDGTISTDYVDGASIQFNSGSHNIFALEQANVRPNPAQFDPGLANAENPDGQYSGTGAALAAYGARVRATISILTVDAAYLGMRDVDYNIGSGVIPLGGGTSIGGSTSTFGISSADIDVDGLSVVIVGQPIPDTLNGSLPAISATNTAVGSIANLGGAQRRLTYSITENITIDIEGVMLNGSASGTIVAFATVPEPGAFVLAGIGLLSLVGWRIRRQAAA